MSNYYNRKARLLFDKYQRLDPDDLHAHWLKHLPLNPGLALEVGGGSGRDANWLARKGWEVIAAEPAQALLELGKKATGTRLVTWVDDCLPELAEIQTCRQKFSLILVGGVLMHLSQQERDASMETLISLMADDALLVVTLRQGPDIEGRNFYRVSVDEIVQFAKAKSLQVEVGETMPDRLGRDDVVWQTIVIKNGIIA